VALWTVQGLLALFFALASGAPKLILPADALPMPIPLPHALILFIGVCEVAGALGLILPGLLRVRPGLTPLAAAGLVALEESPPRLLEDHANARRLAEGVAGLPGFGVDPERVQTNIVIFEVKGTGLAPGDICARVRASHGVLCTAFGERVRMVTHYDVSRDDVEVALRALKEVVSSQ
jgi:hypothetical protein